MIPSGCKLKISAFSAVVVDETVEAVTFPPLKVEGGGIRPNGSNGNSQGKVTPPLDPAALKTRPQNFTKELPSHVPRKLHHKDKKPGTIMADDTLETGLLGIGLSDSESSDAETCNPSHTTTTTTTANSSSRADRTALSEEAFQTLKATYTPKLENGEVCSHISTCHLFTNPPPDLGHHQPPRQRLGVQARGARPYPRRGGAVLPAAV